MARKTLKEAADAMFQRFYVETLEQLTHEIRSTRQPNRVLELKKELDALEKVRDRFYHYLQEDEAVA